MGLYFLQNFFVWKHSEMLAITPDPLAYAKEQVELYNREYKEGKIAFFS